MENFLNMKLHTTNKQQNFEIKKGNSQNWSIFTGKNKYKRKFFSWKLSISTKIPIFDIFLEVKISYNKNNRPIKVIKAIKAIN
jgi:hypothetical protein